jgi:hypothetical protein
MIKHKVEWPLGALWSRSSIISYVTGGLDMQWHIFDSKTKRNWLKSPVHAVVLLCPFIPFPLYQGYVVRRRCCDCCRHTDVTSATRYRGARRDLRLTCWRSQGCPRTWQASGSACAARPGHWVSSSPADFASMSESGRGAGSTDSTPTLPAPCRPSPPLRLAATLAAPLPPAKYKVAPSSTSGSSMPLSHFLTEGWLRISRVTLDAFQAVFGRSECPGI